MKEYVIVKLNKIDLDVLLICLTHENIYQHLEEIKQESVLQKGSGYLLLDQLLVTGDGDNRFVLIPYHEGIFELQNAKNIVAPIEIRQITVEVLNKNSSVIKNSILTRAQREKIEKKIAI